MRVVSRMKLVGFLFLLMAVSAPKAYAAESADAAAEKDTATAVPAKGEGSDDSTKVDGEDKPVGNKSLVLGPKLRIGGRFDNVRMCVASPADSKGGPAADISISTEIAMSDTVSLEIDLPFFRPIMFGLSFKMLQFEPSVSLRFRKFRKMNRDLILGPMLGVSLHYGPDYHSENSGDGRLPSFFAMGPMVGGYFGVDFKRPCQKYNFQIGVTPYVIPLFGVNDDENHKGIVVGALLDFSFRFGKPNATE